MIKVIPNHPDNKVYKRNNVTIILGKALKPRNTKDEKEVTKKKDTKTSQDEIK